MPKYKLSARAYSRAVYQMARHRGVGMPTMQEQLELECGLAVAVRAERADRVVVTVSEIPANATRTAAYLHQNILRYLRWAATGANTDKTPDWVPYVLPKVAPVSRQLCAAPIAEGHAVIPVAAEATPAPAATPMPVAAPVAAPAVAPVVAAAAPTPTASERRRGQSPGPQVALPFTYADTVVAACAESVAAEEARRAAAAPTMAELAAFNTFVNMLADRIVKQTAEKVGTRIHSHLGRTQRELTDSMQATVQHLVARQNESDGTLKDMWAAIVYVAKLCNISKERLAHEQIKARQEAANANVAARTAGE